MPPLRRPAPPRAFTLAELLVVIAVVAALLALLLPALGRAREQANLVRCLATLQEMARAAHLHAQEHRGHMPLAGGLYGNLPRWPNTVRDPARLKYTYFADPDPRPAPLTASLGHYLNLPVALGSRAELEASLASEAVQKHFRCPADRDVPRRGKTLWIWNPPTVDFECPDERLSYVFNGAVLGQGWDPRLAFGRGLMGNFSRLRRPAEVFLFADGMARRRNEFSPLYQYEIGEREAMFEAVRDYGVIPGSGRDPEYCNFDQTRHRLRMNIAFVDGHAETVRMPDLTRPLDLTNRGDLARVGVFAGFD